MEAKHFPEANLRIAENQEKYQTLPAFANTEEGSLTFCLQLEPDELERLVATGGELWFKVLTFGRPMQPVNLSTVKSDFIPE